MPFLSIVIAFESLTGALVLLFSTHLLLVRAMMSPGNQWFGPVVTHFATDAREVWITIDDGPDAEQTAAILDLLGRHGAKATFFVKGTDLSRSGTMGSEIISRGHQIANHSFTHPSATFWLAGPARIAREVDRCNEIIRDVAGESPLLFRAPVGMKNVFVHPVLRDRGMILVGWSGGGYDTVSRNVDRTVERITGDIRPGAILLLHQGRRAGQQPDTPLEIIRRVVEEVDRRGYRAVIPPVSALRCGAGECTR